MQTSLANNLTKCRFISPITFRLYHETSTDFDLFFRIQCKARGDGISACHLRICNGRFRKWLRGRAKAIRFTGFLLRFIRRLVPLIMTPKDWPKVILSSSQLSMCASDWALTVVKTKIRKSLKGTKNWAYDNETYRQMIQMIVAQDWCFACFASFYKQVGREPVLQHGWEWYSNPLNRWRGVARDQLQSHNSWWLSATKPRIGARCSTDLHLCDTVIPTRTSCDCNLFQPFNVFHISTFLTLGSAFEAGKHSAKGHRSPARSTLSSLRPHFFILSHFTLYSITWYNLDHPEAWLEVKWTLTEAEPQLTSPVPSGAEVLPAASLFWHFLAVILEACWTAGSWGNRQWASIPAQSLCVNFASCFFFVLLFISTCFLNMFALFIHWHMAYFLHSFVQYFVQEVLSRSVSGLAAPPGRRRF